MTSDWKTHKNVDSGDKTLSKLSELHSNMVTQVSNMEENWKDTAPTYLLLPLGKWGSKWGDFHWAMGCV